MSPQTVKLSAEQEEVVRTRGEALHVIACAGSGKTESISRSVAALVYTAFDPIILEPEEEGQVRVLADFVQTISACP